MGIALGLGVGRFDGLERPTWASRGASECTIQGLNRDCIPLFPTKAQ